MHDEDHTTAAPDSPLARLRANYQARQEADKARYVPVWDDDLLVAQIRRSADLAAAKGVMRAVTALAAPQAAAEAIDLTTDDLADIVAAATLSLHEREPDGTLTPLLDEDGDPLKFNAWFGKAIGFPEVTTGRDAVILAFTDGDPPELDTLKLMLCATSIAGALVSGRVHAEAAVGEASAPRS